MLAAGAALTLGGCQLLDSGPRRPVEPVVEEASETFKRARLLLAAPGGTAQRGRARELAGRAVELEPTWAAPRRFLDDLARADLAGAAVLAGHLAVIEERPADALHLYLAARLEGAGAAGHMRAAATADDGFAWGHHGLAWLARQERRWDAAEMYARRALARARDPYERALFTEMVARAAAGAQELERAVGIIDSHLAEAGRDGAGVPEPERSRLAVLAVQLGARAEEPEQQEGAFERGCELLAEGSLVPGELFALTRTLARLLPVVGLRRGSEASARRLRTALAMGRSRAGYVHGPWDALYAELLLAAEPTPLALDLLERSGARTPAALLRAARFAGGRPREALEGWLAELPEQVLDGAGAPLDARLAELAREARAADAPGLALGESCLDSGWFAEARACAGLAAGALQGADGASGKISGGNPAAESGAGDELARARQLYAAAEAGQFALDELAHTLERMDAGMDREGAAVGTAGAGGDSRDAGGQAAAFDLDEVLAEARAEAGGQDGGGLGELLLRLAPALTVWETLRTVSPSPVAAAPADCARVTVEDVLAELRGSPRVSFSGIGEMVHCGPLFSERDAAAGRGEDGTPVPGLAAYFSAMGRFGLFGTHTLDPVPDGVVLPMVLAEFRRGEHLGVPWSGTVVWCEGADLAPRAARSGARITGSALHEGYWVDIEAVRGEQDAWSSLVRRFFGAAPDALREVRRSTALESRGLDLARRSPDQIRRGRVLAAPLLGAGNLVRLAVLAERGGAPPTLSELVATTARHEEGHLCDRSRFLPLSENKGKALGFFMRCGFSPDKVMRRLEYRAQLTAMCVDADPRLALAQVLLAADRPSAAGSILPHGEAYKELLADVLDALDQALDAEPGAWEEIHPTRTLAHQLHHLAPEQVRTLARRVAREEGLL